MNPNDRIAAGLSPGFFIGRMSELLLATYDKLVAALTEAQLQQDEDGTEESK